MPPQKKQPPPHMFKRELKLSLCTLFFIVDLVETRHRQRQPWTLQPKKFLSIPFSYPPIYLLQKKLRLFSIPLLAFYLLLVKSIHVFMLISTKHMNWRFEASIFFYFFHNIIITSPFHRHRHPHHDPLILMQESSFLHANYSSMYLLL